MAPVPKREAAAKDQESPANGGSGGFTRLCVKNVPKHVDERRLKEHFGQRGLVTDAKLLRTKTGESRKMAFVGFRTEDEAKAALAFFNQTFLDTSRLVVEAAMPRGAATLPRPWSKYSEGSSRFETKQKQTVSPGSKRQRDGDEEPEDEESDDGEMEGGEEKQKDKGKKQRRVGKEEFLATMMPRSRTQFWANDELGVVPDATASNKQQQQQQQQKKQKQGKRAGPAEASSSSSDDDEDEEEEEEEEEEDEDGEDNEDAEATSAIPAPPKISDLDYLRSKVKKGLDEEIGGGGGGAVEKTSMQKEKEDDDEDEDEDEEDDESDDQEEEEEDDDNEEQRAGKNDDETPTNEEEEEEEEEANKPPTRDLPPVEETGRLFLRNLPFSTTEEDLMELLSPHGQVEEVHLPLDDAKRAKGFAFASFLLPEDAARAMAALDGQAFQGRLLHVLPAKEPPKDPLAELDPSKARTYKERKEIERRQRAGDDRGWNASFLRSETVVEAVADRLQVEKGAVLNREGEGMAVKLALGETFLLAENREFFRKEGVDLTVLESAAAQQARRKQQKGQPPASVARSKTTLLVKNLPYTTTQEDLTQLFGRFGAMGKVVLPPSRSLGLVDFLEAADARRAFKGLAYKRFQHVPLYLEWAPLHTFIPSTGKEEDKQKQKATSTSAATTAAAAEVVVAPVIPQHEQKEKEQDELDQDEPEGSFTLFVKNLNFATTEEKLAAFFKDKTKGVRTVAIPKKNAPNNPKSKTTANIPLSMGYGFVEYTTVALAKAALKSMEGSMLEGHRLQCKLSDKRLTKASSTPAGGLNKKKMTKLVVRNVAFQATPKELKELFGSFGKVKTVRLPKKFDGSHRGFAFVEFLTAQEASNAFQALSSTHLYGKRLVLEWAEDKDDLDKLREKAGKDARKGAASALSNETGGGGGGKKKKGGSSFDEGF